MLPNTVAHLGVGTILEVRVPHGVGNSEVKRNGVRGASEPARIFATIASFAEASGVGIAIATPYLAYCYFCKRFIGVDKSGCVCHYVSSPLLRRWLHKKNKNI